MKTSLKAAFVVCTMLFAAACKKEKIDVQQKAVESDASKLETFTIGQEYGGGIIIFIDSTGEHGIIAAKIDQSIGATWYNGVFGITEATGKNLGTGPFNTRKIVRTQGNTGIYAARICSYYSVDGFDDWYLPSKNELVEVFKQKALIGAGNDVYWSSTEVDGNVAWGQNFETGGRKKSSKDKIYHVRAVRTF